MIDSRLAEVLAGREDCYVFPFYWQHGNHFDTIPAEIGRIRESGCRAVCVEARPHPDFCGDGWWRDMDCILSECGKRGMKVWILDDKHFPTGFANGAIAKHPELRRKYLFERHLDMIGPMDGASALVPPPDDGACLLGAYAQRRLPATDEQLLSHERIPLSCRVKDGTLCWDVPDGCWRVFFLYLTPHGGQDDYVDFINPESAALQIEYVYKPHFDHYARYFGNVISGFFSDEPQFGNNLHGSHRRDDGMYEYRIGQEGLALPFNGHVLEMMSREIGDDASLHLGELWYESPDSHLTRLAYMNAITLLFRDCFSRPVGDWCRAHGVEYIGHIIEDMNAHGRMGFGPGHYFRSLDGQDMGGIDIVLHQVMPGLGEYMHTSSTLGGAASPAFFHYVLGKLAASISHQNPRMKGRAMCELFGAYGWGEDASMMKWLADFLLVRGINRFVPHAFSPQFPDPDCPPHFGAGGQDPQFDGFSAVAVYLDKMAHLLSGGRHVATTALLYHAESEWMSSYGKAMLMQVPAKALFDAHIDYDITPVDVLVEACVEDGRLLIGDESFSSLVIPSAEYIPAAMVEKIGEFTARGLPVFFVEGVPHGVTATPTRLRDLVPEVLRAAGSKPDIVVDGDFPLLRCYHIVRGDDDVYMLFNEAPSKTAKTRIHLSARGGFARVRLLEDFAVADEAPDGIVEVELLPGQSEVLVFGGNDGLAPSRKRGAATVLHPEYAIELAASESMDKFVPYAITDRLFNINAPDRLPSFSGKMRYAFTIEVNEGDFDDITALDLGKVGITAKVWINRTYAGIRLSEPYLFEVGRYLKPGRNEVVVEVANTLAQRLRDYFSHFLQLKPAGLLGPVSLVR